MLAALHDEAVKDVFLIQLVFLCTNCLFLKLSCYVALLCIYLQSVSVCLTVLLGRINVFIRLSSRLLIYVWCAV